MNKEYDASENKNKKLIKKKEVSLVYKYIYRTRTNHLSLSH